MASPRKLPRAAQPIRARRLPPVATGANGAGRVSGQAGSNGAGGGRRDGYNQLAQVQRARVLTGAVNAACEHGAANLSVAEIVASAGVSRRTFYELFEDRQACLLAACEDALTLAAAEVLPAVQAEDRWIKRLRAGVVAFMGFLDAEPKLGRLLVCESLLAGSRVLERRTHVMRELAGFVNDGCHESKLGTGMPILYAEGAVGGVLSILQNLLLGDSGELYLALAPSLTAMLVMPYLGPKAAQRELDRRMESASTVPSRETVGQANPFNHPGMRLTYRTIRVLTLLAESPGSSNRKLGDLAGIRDQGQISKLLSRLARLGLIANGDGDRAQGAPNAWRLTEQGRQLVGAIDTSVRT